MWGGVGGGVCGGKSPDSILLKWNSKAPSWETEEFSRNTWASTPQGGEEACISLFLHEGHLQTLSRACTLGREARERWEGGSPPRTQETQGGCRDFFLASSPQNNTPKEQAAQRGKWTWTKEAQACSATRGLVTEQLQKLPVTESRKRTGIFGSESPPGPDVSYS